MGNLARRLTGMDENQLRESELTPIKSKSEVSASPVVVPRQNVRFRSGAVIGSEDLEPVKKKLREFVPRALRKD